MVSYSGYNLRDELTTGIAQYFSLGMTNDYFSNGLGKEQDCGMFL